MNFDKERIVWLTTLSLILIIVSACRQDSSEEVVVEEQVKIEEKSKEIPDEEPEIVESTEELEDEVFERVKSIAGQRYDEILAQQPPFDPQEVKKKLFLERFDIDLRKVPHTIKDVEEVEALIEKMAEDAASIKYSDTLRQDVIKKAEREFPLYKVGDLVEVTTLRGSIYGMLERIYPDKVKVEKHYILIDDITSPPPECFSEKKCAQRRDHFLRVNFEVPKDDFKNKCRKDFTPTIFKEEGYILRGKKWVSVDKIFESEIAPEIAKLEKKYAKDVTIKVRQIVESQLREEGLYE